MKFRIILFFTLITSVSVFSQHAFNAAGNSFSTGGFSQSISIGQPFYNYFPTAGIKFTEGVQQAFDNATCVFNFQFPSDSLSICADSFLLDVSSAYPKVLWSTGDSTSRITVKQTGWYKASVVNSIGCVGEDSIFVRITNVNIPLSDTALCMGDSLLLQAYTPGTVIPTNASSIADLPSNLRSHVVAFYPFNGNSNDASGNGNNGMGTDLGMVADRFGKTNAAYAFNGSSSKIVVADSSKLDLTNDFTISSWFNQDDLNNCPSCVRMILSKNKNGNHTDGAYAFGVWGTSTSKINFQASPLFNDQTVPQNNLALIKPGNWYHYAVTYKRADSSLVYYLNGVSVDTVKLRFDIQNTIHQMIIGAETMTPDVSYVNFFKGKLDDILILNKALNEKEVLQLYRPSTYAVGSRGPAGGYIFYDKGDSTGGWRYLEVAPYDQAPQAQWGCYGANVPTSVAFLQGYNNELIFQSNCPTGSAAKICRDATINGYSDWYLPSRDELSMVYDSLFAPFGVGGFGKDNGYYNPSWRYWSSSQSGTPNAWAVDFNFFYKQVQSKLETATRVRAIRRVSTQDQPSAVFPYSYTWSTGETTPSIVVKPLANSNFTVTASDGVKTCSKPISVVVENLNGFNPLPDSLKSTSDSVVLNIPGSFKSVVWNTGSTQQSIIVRKSGKYVVSVTTRGGCTATDSVFVTLVNTKIVATDTIICKGAKVTLEVKKNNVVLQNTYTVGQKGPAGGIVFYDKGTTTNGWRYLEVSAIDNSANYGMGCYCTAVPNTSDSIGAGNINTINWAKLGCSGWATEALNYQVNGYGDWFVPSLNEVKLMYQNLAQKGLGNFAKAGYWSSTPAPYGSCGIDGGAAVVSFNDGSTYSDYRWGYAGAGNVRFIRAFAPPTNAAVVWSTGDTSAAIVVQPTQTTKYYVTTSNGIGSVKDSITISVEDMQLYNPLSDTLKACSAVVRLDAGAGHKSYLWSTGDTSQYIDAKANGRYSVSVISANGCTGKDSAYVNLLSHTKSAKDTTVCFSSNLVLGITAQSTGGPIKYNWNTGSINSSISINPVANSQYRVRISDGISVCNDTFNIYVSGQNFNPLPDTTGYCGDSVVLSVDPGYNQYNWSHGATGATTTVKTNGYYSVTVFNANNCQYSDTTYVMLKGTVALSPNLQDTVRVCDTSASISASPGYAKYLWNTGGTTPKISVKSSGKYTVTVSNNLGCSATQSTFVSIVSSKIIASDSLSCNSTGVLLTSHQSTLNSGTSVNGAAKLTTDLQKGLIAWYPFNGNANDESGNNRNGQVRGASLSSDRNGNSNSSYRFDVGQDIIVPGTQGMNVFPLSVSLWYKLDTALVGGYDNGNIFTKYYPAAWNGYAILTSLSYPDSLGGSVGFPSVQGWYLRGYNNRLIGKYGSPPFEQFNADLKRWYHFVFTVASDTGKIYVDGKLTSIDKWDGVSGPSSNSFLWKIGGLYDKWFKGGIDDIAVYNRVINENEVTQLYNNKTGTISSYKYKWSTGDTTASIFVNPSKTTTYYLTVSDDITTCTDSFVVNVRSKPKAEFYVYNNAACFTTDSIRFVNTSKPAIAGEKLSYQWRFGDGATSNLAAPAHVYPTAGKYTVTLLVSNGYGCSDSMVQVLNFDDLKALAIVNDAAQCLSGNSFNFTSTSTSSSGISQMIWNFGDGTQGSGATVNHVYNTIGNYQVSLLVTSNTGCVKQFVTTVSVSENPVADFQLQSPVTQCSNGNLFVFKNTSVANQGQVSYLWNFGDGTIDTAENPIHTYALPGKFRVQLLVTNETSGCSSLFSTDVHVNTSGSAGFYVGDSALCLSGNLFRFNNSSNVSSGRIVSYNWDFGNGTSSTEINPTVIYSKSGNYLVQMYITTDKGCSDTASLNLNVWAQPNVQFNLNDSIQCIDVNYFVFKNTSSITDGVLSYVWDLGDGTLLKTKDVTHIYKNTGDYKVTLKALSDKGCESTISQTVSVKPKAIASFTVNTDLQCLKNNSFKFTDKSSVETGSYTLEWDFGDGNTSQQSNPMHTYLQAGNYTVVLRVNTAYGCSDSSIYQLRVAQMPKALFAVGSDSSCLNRNQFDFYNFSSISSGTFTNNWLFGDSTGSTDAEPSHQYAKEGDYNVRLVTTSNDGCTDTLEKTVHIYPDPKVAFKASMDSMCYKGNLFTFTNSSSINTGSLKYEWQFGDGSTLMSSDASHSYLSSGNYKVTLKAVSDHGCEDSASLNLMVVANPKAFFNVNKQLSCVQNAEYQFKSTSTAGFGSLSYEWNFGDSTTSKLDSVRKVYAREGSYSVSLAVVNSFGCSDDVSTLVTVVPNPKANIVMGSSVAQCSTNNSFVVQVGDTYNKSMNQFRWSLGDGTNSSDSIVRVSYKDTGDYVVSLLVSTNYGCSDSAKITLRVHPQPAIPVLNPVSLIEVCENSSKVLKSNSVLKNQWFLNGAIIAGATADSLKVAVAGNYKLRVEDKNGCQSESPEVTAVINKLPAATFTLPSAKYVCENDAVVMRATGANLYNWFRNDTLEQSSADSIYLAKKAGVYKLVVYSDKGCSLSFKDSLVLGYLGSLKPQFKFDSTCINIPIHFTNLTKWDTAYSVNYRWNFGDGSSSTEKNPVHIYKDSSRYLVSLNMKYIVCDKLLDSTILPIQLHKPVPGIEYPRLNAKKDEKLQLSARAIGYLYSWTPSDQLSAASIPNPVFTAKEEARLLISIRDTFGCTTVDTLKVLVFEKKEIYVPHGFTPNNDGVNDLLFPETVGIAKFNYFRVFNRWGKLIYETYKTGIGIGWDGKMNGVLQPMDTYLWVSEGVDEDGKLVKRSGNVLLIR